MPRLADLGTAPVRYADSAGGGMTPNELHPTLLQCPHCGKPAGLEQMRDAPTWSRIRCSGYLCGATTAAQPSEEKAVAVWNARAP